MSVKRKRFFIRLEMDIERAFVAALAKGWDQYQWSIEAGVSPATIREFKKGRADLKRSTIEQILAPLGLTIEDLILRDEPKKTTDEGSEMMNGSVA